jgi:hypothetical protein
VILQCRIILIMVALGPWSHVALADVLYEQSPAVGAASPQNLLDQNIDPAINIFDTYLAETLLQR